MTKKYLDWANAGGPNECKHGYAAGVPCPHCDKAQEQRNAGRIARVLRAAGVHTRADLVRRYDAGTAYHDIKGIGPVLGKQLRAMVKEYGAIEWQAATGMPWEG